jgi:hypothetical protein
MLANRISIEGNARTRDLNMDGNIRAQFLNKWSITFDAKTRERGFCWLKAVQQIKPIT